MQVKSIAECSNGSILLWEHSAILSTFIKLPFVIKIFVLSIFEWPFYTGFTVVLTLAVIHKAKHVIDKQSDHNYNHLIASVQCVHVKRLATILYYHIEMILNFKPVYK